MKYRLVALPTGYAVAYDHSALGWTSVSEHATRESAEAEIRNRNTAHQAALAMAASSLQQHRQHSLAERGYGRSVRWVPDDEFA